MGIDRFLRLAVGAVAAVGMMAAVASAQEAASTNDPQPPVYHSTVRSVVLDVVVIGPDGNPVTGLQREDFHLLEDGALQNIQYFRAPGAEAESADKPAGRTVLLVDELNSKFSDLGYAEFSVRKLLNRTGQLAEPTTLMMLTGSGLKVIQDYTRDGSALLAALHAHRNDMTMSLYDQSLSNQTMTNDVVNLENIQHIESVTLGALAQLSDANMASDMRQTVIWISPGLQPRNAMPVFGASDMDNLAPALKRISDIMLRSRTVLYAIDPRGVGMGQTMPYVPVTSLNNTGAAQYLEAVGDNEYTGLNDIALQSLTTSTGGRYFYGRNDVDVAISKSMAMGNGAYMISYSPTNHGFNGGFRKIQISISKPGLTAVTRPGYYALPAPKTATDKLAKYEIDHAVTSRLDYSSLTVSVVPGQITGQKQQITLSVDSRGLHWERMPDGRYDSQIRIMAVTFDGKGKALYSVNRTMSGDLAPDQFEKERNKPWKIAMDVPLDAKQNRVRVIVQDQRSGQIGSAETADVRSSAKVAPHLVPSMPNE